MNLTKENKLDAFSVLAAVVGVALTIAASELSHPLLMVIGAAIVAITAIIRVSYFRGAAHGEGHTKWTATKPPSSGTIPPA